MKKLSISIVAMTMILLLGSCTGSRKVTYFQNIDEISLAASKGLYDARNMPKDQLLITESGVSDPKAVSHLASSVLSPCRKQCDEHIGKYFWCWRFDDWLFGR